jgi:hypothetical protein
MKFLSAILLIALMGVAARAQTGTGNNNGQQNPAPVTEPGQTAIPPAETGTAPSSQAPPSQASPGALGPANAGTPRIAPGSVLPVRLTKTVDAKKETVGKEVDAEVTQDMKAVNGEVMIPKDTKIIGHVTEAQVRTKDQKESEMGIAFDQVVVKGQDVHLPMSIQAIIAPPSANAANSAGGQDASSTPSAPGGGGIPSGNPSGRAGTGGTEPQASNPTAGSGEPATNPQTAKQNQPITGNTQGVIGISNLNLTTAADAKGASMISSEKNNVKLESGTFMLLRVTQ